MPKDALQSLHGESGHLPLKKTQSSGAVSMAKDVCRCQEVVGKFFQEKHDAILQMRASLHRIITIRSHELVTLDPVKCPVSHCDNRFALVQRDLMNCPTNLISIANKDAMIFFLIHRFLRSYFYLHFLCLSCDSKCTLSYYCPGHSLILP